MCRGFWEELASYQGDDPLEVWLRCAVGQLLLPRRETILCLRRLCCCCVSLNPTCH